MSKQVKTVLRFAVALALVAGPLIHCGTPTPMNWNIGRLVGCKFAWVPGSGNANAATPRRTVMSGVYEEVDRHGVKARVIRAENGTVLYASGLNASEAKKFRGRRVRVTGLLQMGIRANVNSAGDLRALPFFREVDSIELF